MSILVIYWVSIELCKPFLQCYYRTFSSWFRKKYQGREGVARFNGSPGIGAYYWASPALQREMKKE